MAEEKKKKSKYSGAIQSYTLPGKLRNLDKNIVKYINVKQTCYDAAEIFRADVNKYIPSRSGTLRDKGYVIHTSNSKVNPWFILQYKNKPKVPYVMYQYVGKIWQPNFAIFDLENDWLTLRAARVKHVGWAVSKKHPRHPTGKPFRKGPETQVLDNGLRITYTGYSRRGCKPEWLTYAFNHSAEVGGWRNEIIRYAERVYASAISEQKKDIAKKEARKQAQATIKRQNTLAKLGIKPNTKTRLRKKNRS